MADAASGRESYQRQAAQESGKTRAGYGASGLSLDSGSILDLIGDQSAEIQSGSADYTRQAAQENAKQRLAEGYYGQKKSLLYEQYEQQRKSSKKGTLLGSYDAWRSIASPLLELG